MRRNAAHEAYVGTITELLAIVQERYPDRVTRSETGLPGTYIKTRDDHTVWVGDHYEWWAEEQMGDTDDLLCTIGALSRALESLDRVDQASLIGVIGEGFDVS